MEFAEHIQRLYDILRAWRTHVINQAKAVIACDDIDEGVSDAELRTLARALASQTAADVIQKTLARTTSKKKQGAEKHISLVEGYPSSLYDVCCNKDIESIF